MENVVLFGASKLGRIANLALNDRKKILYFCDNDPAKWGKRLDGIEIISPQKLIDLGEIKVVITSVYYDEIAKQLLKMGIFRFEQFKLAINLNQTIEQKESIEIKKINLEKFLYKLGKEIKINVAYYTWGSGFFTHVFLKAIMLKFGFKVFLEIGTFMGETIANIAEIADTCYSISLPDENLGHYFTNINKCNFSRYFSYIKKNIVHYYGDSKEFDYKCIPKKVDFIFIDGDHSYEGILADTKKIFSYIDITNTLVAWHDLKINNNYRMPTVNGIFDGVPSSLHKNIFAVEKASCALFIPDNYIKHFDFSDEKEENTIYSYEKRVKVNKYTL